MPLKIIGTGLGRTGTFSLKLALEHLGFGSCYHMTELFQKPEGVNNFINAEKGNAVNWENLFSDYLSAVDYPVARYYKSITGFYNEAKVIHTYREPDEWYESARRTIFMSENMPLKKYVKFGLRFPFSKEVRKRLPVFRYNQKLIRYEFGKNLSDKKHITDIFKRHTDNVIRHINPKRLLVYNVSQGWEPLCKFLNLPVPEIKFPYKNTYDEFMSKVDIIGTGRFLYNEVLH